MELYTACIKPVQGHVQDFIVNHGTSLSLGGTAVFLYYAKSAWDRRRMPPNVPENANLKNGEQVTFQRMHKLFDEYGKEHGPVFTVNLMGKTAVIAYSYSAIHEILVTKSNDFGGRPNSFRFDYLNGYNADNFSMGDKNSDNFSMGDMSDRFMRLKKRALTSLRMYGDGLDKLEEISMEYINELIIEWKEMNGKSFNPRLQVKSAVAKTMGSILCGQKLAAAEIEDFMTNEAYGKPIMNPIGQGIALDNYPWLRFFGNEVFKKLVGHQQNYARIFGKWLGYRVTHMEAQRLDDYEEPECVMDKLISDMNKNVKDASGDPLFNHSNLRVILQDLMIAGVATTTMTLYCLIAMMCTRPHIQQKLQQEIDSVIGGRKPTLADRPNMPYVEATIMETLRFLSHVPMALPHKAIVDTTVCGYRVPKGTTVYPHLWAMHHDDTFWEKPTEFHPEHFLDDKGCLLEPDHIRRRRLMPFGAGRRVCMGEALAKNRIFLFTTSLLQEFDFSKVNSSAETACDIEKYPLKFLLQVPDYVCKVSERQQFFQ